MREAFSYSFVLPPTVFIVLCLVGAVIAFVVPRIGKILVLLNSVFLYVFAAPVVSMLLTQQLVSAVPTKVDFINAQAIVVPGADINSGNGVDIPDSVGLLTLERLANAAQLYRRLRLPVVVSGGPMAASTVSLASLMQRELERNFAVPAQFIEDRSHNTFENALYTSNILKEHQIRNIILVTQLRDMPRALWSFNRVGLHAVPFEPRKAFATFEMTSLLPSAKGFLESFYVIHEIIGLIFYEIFY